jgi:hypothetical protein
VIKKKGEKERLERTAIKVEAAARDERETHW